MSTQQRPPLLNLPSEIRNMVWEHALGGKQIHMDICYHGGQYHALTKRCRNHPFITEIADLPLPNPTDITMWLKTRYTWPQSPAQISPEDSRFRFNIHSSYPQSRAQYRCIKFSASRPSLDLEILRANRQINNEAMPVLYTTNVFSFLLLSHFAEFLLRLKERPRSYLKAIHLGHWWRTFRSYSPEPKSWPAIIGSLPLPALATIYIEVQNTFTLDFAKTQTDAKDKVVDYLRTIQWLVENKGWNIKRIPLGWSMWDGKENVTQDEVLPQWLTIKKELIEERTTVLRRTRQIAEEHEKARAAVAKSTHNASPTKDTTKRGNTYPTQEQSQDEGHEVEAIIDSKYGPGRGGPVIYLVKYVGPSVPEWKSWAEVEHLGTHLFAFHRKHPDNPLHTKFIVL